MRQRGDIAAYTHCIEFIGEAMRATWFIDVISNVPYVFPVNKYCKLELKRMKENKTLNKQTTIVIITRGLRNPLRYRANICVE